MGVGHFAFRYQGNGATPCQYIDTSRKPIDCAITLLLTVIIYWNSAADFSSFIVEIVWKTTNLGIWSPVRGSVEPWLMARWKDCVRLPNWTFFASSYRWRATRQNMSNLAAFRRWWVSLSQGFRGRGHPWGIFLVSTKLDTFCYLTVQTAPCYVQSFWHNNGVWQTDGRTELL